MLILFNFSEMRNKRIHGGSMLDVASEVWRLCVTSFKGLRQLRLPPVLRLGAARFDGIVMVGFAIMLAAFASGAARAESAETAFSVLVFSKTAGYRTIRFPPASPPFGRWRANDFRVDAAKTRRSSTMRVWRSTGGGFLNTTGDIFNPGEQRHSRSLFGAAGIRRRPCASDTEYDWPWYGRLLERTSADTPPFSPRP